MEAQAVTVVISVDEGPEGSPQCSRLKDCIMYYDLS